MSRTTKPLEVVPFTNSIGEVINPGDEVIIVTCSTGRVGSYVGKYLGLRTHKRYNNSQYVNVSVEKMTKSQRLVHNETGEEYDYKAERAVMKPPEYPVENTAYRWGPERSEEWNRKYAEYQKAVNEYSAAIRERRKDYSYKPFFVPRRGSLRKNVIFKRYINAS
jgi:hypothetical protein